MRKAELLEEPGEVALGLLQGDLRVGVDAEEKAGSQVGDGEGEAVGTIAEAELALVVGGPDVVGSGRDGLGAAGGGTGMGACGRARDSRSGRTSRSGRSTCGQSYVRCRSGRPGRWWCRR